MNAAPSTPAEDVVERMMREPKRWAAMDPSAVAGGSDAQAAYCIADAQHDIGVLLAEITRLRAQLANSAPVQSAGVVEANLRRLCGLFDAQGALFASAEYQVAVVAAARAALAATSPPASGQAQPVGEREAFTDMLAALKAVMASVTAIKGRTYEENVADGKRVSDLAYAAIAKAEAARQASSVIPVGEQTPTVTGIKDKNGNMLRRGDRVRYCLGGKHTKEEYWNPEYEVIWKAPRFTLQHVGGGKDGGDHDFILRSGPYLELLQAAPPPASVPGVEITEAVERVAETAVWLFRAFVRGVASKDVQDCRMSQPSADDWMTHTIKEFEANLSEAARTAPFHPTHIHKATGVEYRLVGVGPMETHEWLDGTYKMGDDRYSLASANGRQVATYLSADASLLTVPAEEQSERFDALPGDGEGKL